jgi:hypothetical protein
MLLQNCYRFAENGLPSTDEADVPLLLKSATEGYEGPSITSLFPDGITNY